jgi:DNA repair exonuclease SbcCD ATPase subunit
MLELIFKSIEIRNFLSVGNKPLSIEFDRGINFVCGWNYQTGCSNAVGKSVVFFSSILYVLFGETGNDIKQSNLINYKNKQKMYVKLVLEKNNEEVVVYRGRKPNVFSYTYKGTTYQNDNVYETQTQLNKLLDISEDVFTNIFIINASDVLDFIKEEGSVKLRDRFEKIFFKDVIFKRVLDTVRKEYNAVQKQVELNNSKIQEKITFLQRLKGIIESSKKVDNYEKQLERYKKQKEETEEKLMLVENSILQQQAPDKLKKLQEKKNEYINRRDGITSKIYHYTERINDTNRKMGSILGADNECPLCHQSIDEHTTDKLKKEYEEEVQSLAKAKKDFETEKNLCDEKLKKIADLEKQLQNLIVKYAGDQSDLKLTIYKVSEEMKFFQENYKNHMDLVQEFNSVKGELTQLRNENGSLDTTVSDLAILTQLFDNSSGGILNFFIEKVLKVLNQTILKFIRKMDMDFTFRFDSNLRLKFDLQDTLSLNNFSGGEKKIINFIVLFSLLEFFYNTLSFRPSILIIDEVADTTVSVQKVELIFEILNKFHKDNNVGVYLLSHNYSAQHNSVISFNKIIELEKRDFTGIKEIKTVNP